MITVVNTGADPAARVGEREKQVTFKYCTPVTKRKSSINKIQIDNARDLDVLMPMYI